MLKTWTFEKGLRMLKILRLITQYAFFAQILGFSHFQINFLLLTMVVKNVVAKISILLMLLCIFSFIT